MNKVNLGHGVFPVLIDALIVLLVTSTLLLNTDLVKTNWLLFIPLFVVIVLFMVGVYKHILVDSKKIRIITSVLFSVFASCFLTYMLFSGTDSSRIKFFLIWFPTVSIALLVWRIAYRKIPFIRSTRKVCFIAIDSEYIADLTEHLQSRSHLYSIENLDDSSVSKISDVLNEFSERKDRPILVYGESLMKESAICTQLLALKLQGFELYSDVAYYSNLKGKIKLSKQDSHLSIERAMRESSVTAYSGITDNLRLLGNFFFGWLLLLIFCIPMLIIAVIIKTTSKGPVLFKQERLGQGRKPITIYKFRSMTVDAEKNGPMWASPEDQRVTKVGNMLRELHLDELPQLINICMGDLAFVGPRPIRKHFADLLADEIPNYNLRFLVQPGLTGWAQTLGPYGVDEDEHKEKFEYDLYYITNRYEISNLMIVALTLSKVISSVFGLLTRDERKNKLISR